MKKIPIVVILMAIMASCKNENPQATSINNSVLDISIGDSRNQVKEKLDEQGYKWEEPRDQTGLSWIYLKDKVQFSGYYFGNLTYYIFDAKVAWIILSEEYPSESAAKKDYDEIAPKLVEKYGQFKIEKKNDNYTMYSVFDDMNTELSISLSHHPKEDVPDMWKNDAETMWKAREYWEVSIIYKPSEKKENQSDRNDF